MTNAELGKGIVKRIGILDQFGESGPYLNLLAMNGVEANNIVNESLMLLKKHAL